MSAAERVVLALDEGTTSARTIAVDRAGRVVASAQREFEQRYPAPGDVRHDPDAIWDAQVATAREVIGAVATDRPRDDRVRRRRAGRPCGRILGITGADRSPAPGRAALRAVRGRG